MTNALAKNTDTELWREIPDDYYAPSIHVTQDGRLGINVGGLVIVATLRQWHEWAMEFKRIEGADEAHTAAITLKKIKDRWKTYIKRQAVKEQP